MHKIIHLQNPLHRREVGGGLVITNPILQMGTPGPRESCNSCPLANTTGVLTPRLSSALFGEGTTTARASSEAQAQKLIPNPYEPTLNFPLTASLFAL